LFRHSEKRKLRLARHLSNPTPVIFPILRFPFIKCTPQDRICALLLVVALRPGIKRARQGGARRCCVLRPSHDPMGGEGPLSIGKFALVLPISRQPTWPGSGRPRSPFS